MNTYNKEYYLQNRDRIIASTKKWQQNNKEKVREHNKQYREKLKNKMEMLEVELRVMKTTCEGFRESASIWESKAVDLGVENKELRRQLALKNHVTKKRKLDVSDILLIAFIISLVAFTIFIFCMSFKS